jgi:hypothetical protein
MPPARQRNRAIGVAALLCAGLASLFMLYFGSGVAATVLVKRGMIDPNSDFYDRLEEFYSPLAAFVQSHQTIENQLHRFIDFLAPDE